MKNIEIYRFGAINDGSASMHDMLGGKGANLAEMASLGLPVPPGFTIPTHASVDYLNLIPLQRFEFMDSLTPVLLEGIAYLKKQFGYVPLVSVRSGARVSMPGMMDTILNVGIDDSTLAFWQTRLGERAALDSYRRFLQMYGATALEIPMHQFESHLTDIRVNAKVATDAEIPAPYLVRLITRYKDVYTLYKKEVPDQQSALVGSVKAVFESWLTPRAVAYRKDNNISDDWGTAVTIQAMVFGNGDNTSCSGVAFTRDRDSGAKIPMGDWLVNAQGEDVVAGIRPTEPLVAIQNWNPEVYVQLLDLMGKLELHFKDMQDIEFTVSFGKLWLLQTRSAKRAAAAAFKVAVDMVSEGLITQAVAMTRVRPAQLIAMFKPVINPNFKGKPVATGFAAGGRIVSGLACFSSKAAIAQKKKGSAVILVRKETDPDDYEGIMAALGVLTSTGGSTSHAAVVARGRDKTCVVGCTSMTITDKTAVMGSASFTQGDLISIDGDTGNVYLGTVPVIEPKVTEAVQLVASWFTEGDFAYRVTENDITDVAAGLLGASGTVAHIDTCTLNPSANLALLSAAIVNCKFSRVVIDLTSIDSYYSPIDQVFNKMFGGTTAHVTSVNTVETLYELTPEAIAKTVVSLPSQSAHGAYLRKAGFKVVGAINTVADLLEMGDVSGIGDDTIKLVFGSKEALLWVQEAMAKAGKVTMKPLPPPQYWYEPFLRTE